MEPVEEKPVTNLQMSANSASKRSRKRRMLNEFNIAGKIFVK